MSKNLYLGVDIGGTKIAVGVVDSSGDVLYSLKCPTPQNASSRTVYNHLLALIKSILKENKIGPIDLKGIGVGVPGIVKPNHRDILVTPNIKLAGFPLASELENNFKIPIVIANDVNLGLLGEKWMGAAQNAKNAVGIFLGTGVGGAILINGHLLEGSDGAAAEIGHMYLDLHSTKTSAGLKGTLEALAGRRSLEREIKELIRSGKKSLVSEMLGKNFTVIKSSVLSKALRKKDPVVTSAVNHLCFVLGHACISLRHVLNPDMFVFGGGVIEACGWYIIPRVQKISDANPFFKKVDHCKIIRSWLGDDAVILGAVALLKQSLGDKIAPQRDFYPPMKMTKNKRVNVDGKILKPSFYIRADGRLKEIEPVQAIHNNSLKKTHQLGIDVLRKACKKSPHALIVGHVLKNSTINAQARQFLMEKSIHKHVLPLSKAVQLYNNMQDRKAFIAF